MVLPSEASPVQRSRAGSSCDFGRPSGAERARAPMSSAPAEPSGLDSETSAGAVFSSSQVEQFRAPWRSRASSSGHFERPSGAERARAAVSSAPAEPSGLERPFRAPQRSRAGSMSQTSAGAVFSKPGRAELSRLERPFRAPQRSRAGSSGHFERPSGAERARAAISSAPAEPSGLDVANVGRCGVFEARPSQLSRVKLWSLERPSAPAEILN